MAAMAATSTFSVVYAPEISGNDIAFVAHLAQEALDGDIEELWHSECRRFDTREHFVDALAQYQAALLDQLVRSELPPEAAARTGGADGLLSMVDTLRADPAAHADLDRLVTLISEFRRHNLA